MVPVKVNPVPALYVVLVSVSVEVIVIVPPDLVTVVAPPPLIAISPVDKSPDTPTEVTVLVSVELKTPLLMLKLLPTLIPPSVEAEAIGRE